MIAPAPQNVPLDTLEKTSRWSSHIAAVGTLVLLTTLLYSVTHLSKDTKQIDAQQKLIEVSSTIGHLRSLYQTILDSPSSSADVNKRSRQLIAELLSVNDKDLSKSMQVFKHELLAYSWAIATGSESDTEEKLKAADALIKECANAKELVAEVAGSTDSTLESTRSWIIEDDAMPRIERLTAVGFCTRSTITHNRGDALKAREIIATLPKDYMIRERPQLSYELRPCLLDSQKSFDEPGLKPK